MVRAPERPEGDADSRLGVPRSPPLTYAAPAVPIDAHLVRRGRPDHLGVPLSERGKTDSHIKALISAMQSAKPTAGLPLAWSGKGFARVLLLLAAAALIAAAAAAFGIARDYGYLHASILTGSAGGQYYALATRLAERARREHGTLNVIATAGSIENVDRLTAGGGSFRIAFSSMACPEPRSFMFSSARGGVLDRNSARHCQA